jgi:hypothetical protein
VAPIIGWDVGGRTKPAPLPLEGIPDEIILVRAAPTIASGDTAILTAGLRIWGLHSLLIVTVTVYMRLRREKDPSDGPYPPSQMAGSLHAYPIVKSGNLLQPVLEGLEMPAAQVWLQGGVLSMDGAEFNTGMQGVEILAPVKLHGPCDHELVATVQVRQAQPLGCAVLAQKLIDQLVVEKMPTVVFG